MTVLGRLRSNVDNLLSVRLDTANPSWEDGAKLLDDCHSLFVEDIGEAYELELVVVLIEAKVQQILESIIIADQDLGPAHPVRADATSRRFAVQFGRHKIVSYTVTNESFSEGATPQEEFSGRLFRFFSESRLLDYVRSTGSGMIALNEPLIHYEIVCENHVIDVIALEPPTITLL